MTRGEKILSCTTMDIKTARKKKRKPIPSGWQCRVISTWLTLWYNTSDKNPEHIKTVLKRFIILSEIIRQGFLNWTVVKIVLWQWSRLLYPWAWKILFTRRFHFSELVHFRPSSNWIVMTGSAPKRIIIVEQNCISINSNFLLSLYNCINRYRS